MKVLYFLTFLYLFLCLTSHKVKKQSEVDNFKVEEAVEFYKKDGKEYSSIKSFFIYFKHVEL